MNSKLLNKRNKLKNVKYADDDTINRYPELLKKITSLFNKKISLFEFHSDDSSLAFILNIPLDGGIIKYKKEKYCLNILNEAFNLKLKNDDLYESLKKVLPKINKNIKKYKKVKVDPFLGILYLKNKDNELLNLDFIISIKNQVEYFSGYIFSKKNQFEDNETSKRILEDHKDMEKMVYGKSLIQQYEIKTVEGDLLSFSNILEVSNWLTARACNYSPGRGLKENW